MSTVNHRLIIARWFAGDLAGYRSVYPLRVLSVHRQVVNLVVNGWPHLLALSSPALYKGPAAICLEEEGFFVCRDQISRLSTGWFQPGSINLAGKEGGLTIDWANCPSYLFDPPPLPAANPLKLNRPLDLLRSRLSLAGEVPSSAALLGIEGGESYFRAAIMESFPPLVGSLLTGSKEQFDIYCRRLCGLGRGATPTGDDLIHAAVITCRYYFHSNDLSWTPPDYPSGLRFATTYLGAHMLEMARRGLTVEPVRNLLSGIFTGTLNLNRINLLLEIGSSTGYDLAAAIWYTLSYLLDNRQIIQLR